MRLVNLQGLYSFLFTPGTQVDLVGQVADPTSPTQPGFFLNKGENFTLCVDNQGGGAAVIPFGVYLQAVPGGLWSTVGNGVVPPAAELTFIWTLRGYAVRVQTFVLAPGAPWTANVSATVYATV